MASCMHALAVEPGVSFREIAVMRGLTLRVVTNVADAASFWDTLAASAGGSVYQSRRFLEPWITHVAPTLGIVPRLGLVCDSAGAPIAFLPFGALRRGPLQTIVYLGGRDANLNMPLVAAGAMIPCEAVYGLLRDFAKTTSPRADVFVLTNNARHWKGERNPFAPNFATPSPSNAFGATLGNDAAAFLAAHDSRDARKKLRSKAARLATLGDVRVGRALPHEVATVVETLLAQKQKLFAGRGIDVGLDGAHVTAFLSDLATRPVDAPALDLYVLRVGDTITAVFGGLPHGAHWHGLITSYSMEPAIARCSPGDLLLRALVEDLVRRGMTSFDLGIGEARYKAALCDETVELVDTIVPVTALGRIYASAEKLRLRTKRQVKKTPWAMNAARRMQRFLARREPPSV